MPKLFMVTNGTNLSKLLMEIIKEYEIKSTISLDGPLYINDQLRINKNGEGTYNSVYNNLIQMEKNNVKPGMVEATYTNLHEINHISRCDLRNILKTELHIPNIYVTDCTTAEFKPKTNDTMDKEMIKRIDDVMLNNNKMDYDYEALDLIERILGYLNNKSITNNLFCSAGYGEISILGNGDYYPCHIFVGDENYKMGNILDDKSKLRFKDILKKDEIECCKDCWSSKFCTKCSWDLINQKNTPTSFYEINLCNQKRAIIKHIILRYINFTAEEKKKLVNIINDATKLI